jgi:hypothetical protein
MTSNSRHVARMLGWAGLLPFAALALGAYIGVPDWIDRLLVGYAVAILCFLCGSLWMSALELPAGPPQALVASNLIVLAALPALVLPLAWAAPWLAVLFAAHFISEWHWVAGDHPGWYRRLRAMLSGIGIVLLLATGAAALSFQAAS